MTFKTLAMSRVTFTLFIAIGLVVDTAVRADETSSAPVPARSEKSSLPNANDPAIITTAIILGEGEKTPILYWESELLAELGKISNVRIVDRSAIRHILDELELNASGMVDPTQAIKLGKLAAAEAIIVLEKDSTSKPPLAVLRLIDTRTGIQLFNSITLAEEFEKRIETLAGDLRSALDKSRIPDEKRRYVGVMDIHSEESGHLLDGVARSLMVIVEHDLGQLPQAIVLERKQLQRLTSERNLSGIELNLRTSAVLVEGGVRRGSDPSNFTLTLRLIPLAGGKAKELQVTLPAKEYLSKRKAIVEDIAKGLDAASGGFSRSDAREEAKAFVQRGLALRSHRQSLEAVPFYEAAWALNPDLKNYHAITWCYLDVAQSSFEKVVQGLQARLRINELMTEALDQTPPASLQSSDFPLHYFVFGNPDLGRSVTTAREKAESQQLIDSIRTIQRRNYQRLSEILKDAPSQRGNLHLVRLEGYHTIAATPEEYCPFMKSLIAEIEDELTEQKIPRTPSNDYYRTFCDHLQHEVEFLTTPLESLNGSDNSSELKLIEPWQPESIQPLLTWLVEQKDPTLRISGYYGFLRLPNSEDKTLLAKKLLDTLFHDFPEENCTAIDVHQMFAIDAMTQEAAKCLQKNDELSSYCHAMLDRADASKDVSELVLWTSPISSVLSLDPKGSNESYERILRIFDQAETKKLSPLARQKMQYLEQMFTTQLNYRLGKGQYAPPLEGPWSEYEIKPIPITSLPPGCLKFLRVSIDRNTEGENKEAPIIMTGFGMARKTASGSNEWDVDVMRLGLEGGEPRHVARYSAENAGVRCIATSPKAIFLGTWNGIVMIEDGHVEQFTEQRGSPGVTVSAMDWLEGSLYVGYEGMLARFDPATKQFSTLASSKAVKIDSELDGQGMYSVESILADSKNHCLWFSVGKSRNRVGIWKYSPETGKFAKIHEGVCSQLSWSDGQIFFDARSLYPELKSFCCLDPATQKISHLPQTSFHPAVGGQVEPNWAYMDHRILSGSRHLQTDDGKNYLPNDKGPFWQSLERYGFGCLAATLNDPKLWYIERRSSSQTSKKE